MIVNTNYKKGYFDMRLIFVRHGDPDYINDSLTEKGWREAALLADRISGWDVTDFYTSPLGRAQATASCTLKKMNRRATVLDWTREFSYFIDDPVTGKHGVPWDLVSSYWTNEPLMFDRLHWTEADIFKQNKDIPVKYKEVCDNLDSFLAGYGYVRENHFYRMPDKKETFITETIAPGSTSAGVVSKQDKEPVVVIFCHLGAICIMLSHLLNIPFPLLVHGFFLPTTSLTILSTEERWSNEAYFRVQTMGDTNHLASAKEPISSAGYFTTSFQG